MKHPRKKARLPKVPSKEMKGIIAHTNNIESKCIVSLLFISILKGNDLLGLKKGRYLERTDDGQN